MSSDPASKPREEDVRLRILDAAEARFCEFGFNKTGMAVIATDVHGKNREQIARLTEIIAPAMPAASLWWMT